MSSAKRYLLIALSFALALTVFAAFAPRAVHAVTATLVQIVNTPANPVPVAQQGPVDTSGSNVNIANTPTVNVASMPPVSVGSVTVANTSNAPVLTRDVENPAKFPLAFSGTATVPQGFVGSFGQPIGASITAGMRYVIEYVSFDCPSNSSVRVAYATFSVAQKIGGGYTFHNYPIPLVKSDANYSGYVSSMGTQSVRWYHDGGQSVQVGLSLSGAAPTTMTCYVEVSGYVVAAP